MLLKLYEHPHSILRKRSEEIKQIKDKHIKLAAAMHFYMKKWNGIGLSAVQVGRLLRLIVMNTGRTKRTLFNPVVLETSIETQKINEGCLSFKGLYLDKTRPLKIKVSYTNQDNTPVIEEFTDIEAVVVLHEIEHLDGILLIDNV